MVTIMPKTTESGQKRLLQPDNRQYHAEMEVEMDFPTYKCNYCDRTATHRIIGHHTVRGEVCNAHIPKDGGDAFALND